MRTIINPVRKLIWEITALEDIFVCDIFSRRRQKLSNRVNLKIWLVIAVSSLGLIDTATAVERYVPSQYPTIQAAINGSANGDTVIVAPGTYTGTGNRNIDFCGKSITVKSAHGPESCIIDCQADLGHQCRGFYFHTNEGQNSILDGFTITNGLTLNGGGIYCQSSSPIIKRCKIFGNQARTGDGGGIFCDERSRPRILDSIIRDNIASNDGGGIYCEDLSNALVSNCAIYDNRAGRDGGGIVSWYSSHVQLKDCVVVRNHAMRDGGGLEGFHDSPVLLNCLIADNSTGEWGGGICVIDGPNFTVINCTISNNHAVEGGGIYARAYTTSRLRNSILYGNLPNQISEAYYSKVTAEYADVEGGWSGRGNFDLPPQFVDENNSDPNERDYHLLPDSPCINAGDPNYVAGPNEMDCDGEQRVMLGRVDMGADEFNPFEVTFDVVNKSRISRTVFEYDCNVTLANISRFTVRDVQLEIVKTSENMVIIEPNVTFGDVEIGAGESATSIDTCTFQVDRSEAIDPVKIIWKSTCQTTNSGQEIQDTASGMVFLRLENTAGESKVDLAGFVDKWLWKGEAGGIKEDVTGDGTINLRDFAALAEKWLGF